MFKMTILAILAISIFSVGNLNAQDVSQRTQSLVAALDKTKYKKKEKRDLSLESYVDVKNRAAVRSNPSEYSGVYDGDQHRLELSVSSNGTASGSGYDDLLNNSAPVRFTLRDARVEGALLTGVKVYENGEARKFEAAFVDRTVRSGKNANDIESRETSFGIGWLEGGTVIAPGTGETNSWTNRVFLEKR